MKKILIALLLGLTAISTNLRAQQHVTLEGISSRGFSGVQTIDGSFFYTFYFGEKTENKDMANFVLQLYDQDLKSIATKTIEITKFSKLAASAFNGKYFFFIFADPNKNTETFVTIDKQGNLVKQKVNEGVRAALLVPDNYPDVFPESDDDFLVVTAEKEKKFGYEVERMDKEFNSRWTKSFFPENGSWSIEDAHILNGKLYILRTEKAHTVGDKYFYTVQAINADNGEQLYATALNDGDDGGFPGFIRVADDGTVAAGGMYFHDGRYSDKNSDGCFFALISPDGKMKFNKASWSDVKQRIKDDYSQNIFAGKTKVLIEDLIHKKDGGYVLVSETFQKGKASDDHIKISFGGGIKPSSKENELDFSVLDFVLFNFSASGELTGITKIDKESREAVVKGSMAGENALTIAEWLGDKRKFFCYKSTVEFNGKQYILFKNEDGAKMRAYFMPIDGTTTENLPNIDLDKWVSDKLNKWAKLSKAKHTFEYDPMKDEISGETYKNIIAAKPGFMLLYNFNYKGNMDIWLEPIPTTN